MDKCYLKVMKYMELKTGGSSSHHLWLSNELSPPWIHEALFQNNNKKKYLEKCMEKDNNLISSYTHKILQTHSTCTNIQG